MRFPTKPLCVLLSVLHLTLASTVASKFVYQYIFFILIAVIILLSELTRLKKYKAHSTNILIQVFNIISKIAFLMGFFILVTNVFILKVGEQSCDTCVVASVKTVIGAAMYLIFYFLFMWFIFSESYRKLLI